MKKQMILVLLFAAFMMTGKAQDGAFSRGTVFLSEDFSANVLPYGWTAEELGDPGYGWEFDNHRAIISSDAAGGGNYVFGTLTTPALDLSEATNVRIGLNHYYRQYLSSYAQINISTDGIVWITAYEFGSSQGDDSYPLIDYDITDMAAGEEEVYIQFLYNDDYYWGWYWEIDQVVVYEADLSLPDNSIQIGSGNHLNLNLPVFPLFNYTYSQNIYLQSEINDEIWITDLYYYWDGTGAGTYCKDWVIFLGHTDKTEFTDSQDWLPVTDMMKVFDGEVNLSWSAGWVQIPLDIPFFYNNDDNLVIAVDQNTPNWGNGKFFGSQTPDNRGILYYSDSNNPNPNNPPIASNLVAGIANILLQYSETEPGPIAYTNPGSLEFGPVLVDESSDVLSVVIQNVGGGQLIIDGMEIIGDDSDDFEIISSHPSYIFIPTFESITVEVAFTPTSKGTRSAILELDDSNIPGYVAQIPLHGIGVPVDPPDNFTATAAGVTEILLEWDKNVHGNDVIIAHNMTDEFGETMDGEIYEVGDVLPGGGIIIYIGAAESFLHEDVAPDTEHYYMAWSITDNNKYSLSVETYGTPLCSTIFDIPLYEDFQGIPDKRMPVCWSTIIESNEGRNHWIGAGGEAGFSSLVFYNDYETDPTLIAITPELNADINSLFIEFYAHVPLRQSKDVSVGITIGVISDPQDLSTFQPLKSFEPQWGSVEKITYYFHQYNGTAKHIALKAFYSWTTVRYIFVPYILIDYRPSCMPPGEAEADNITTSSADISWDPGHEENQWYLIYGLKGFDPYSEGTTVMIDWDPEYTIENLDHSTQYDVYVQAKCGINDLSELNGPLTFTTLCEATPEPIVENFDTTPEGELPLCWSSITDNNSTIETSAQHAFSEPHSLAMLKWATSSDAIILISPELDNDIQNLYMKFFAKNMDSWGSTVLEMGTMTDPMDAETFTLLQSFSINSDWEQHFYLFDGYTGSDQYIAFRVSLTFAMIALDDIIIEVFDECLRPTAFHFVSAEAEFVLLDWTPGYNEENWDLMYGLPGFSPGAGGIGTKYVDHRPYTLDGLEPGTSYDLYLRSFCGTYEQSPWVGPLTVKTLPCYDEDKCTYTVQLIDSWGDGWDGTVLGFRQDGLIVATFGEDFTNGSEFGPVEAPLCPDELTEIVVVNLGWYTEEKGFSVYDPEGTLVFHRDPGLPFLASTIFHTFMADCGSEAPEVPDFLEISNETAGSGQEVCYNATQTITVAGNGSTFTVENGGTANLIAGQNIIMLPGVTVHHGGKLHAWITTDDSYCENLPPIVAQHFDDTEDIRLEDQLITTGRRQSLLAYPNPTGGIFTLEIPENAEESLVIIEVYNMIGENILQTELPLQRSYTIDLTGYQPGMYIVRVIQGQEMDFVKVVKQ